MPGKVRDAPLKFGEVILSQTLWYMSLLIYDGIMMTSVSDGMLCNTKKKVCLAISILPLFGSPVSWNTKTVCLRVAKVRPWYWFTSLNFGAFSQERWPATAKVGHFFYSHPSSLTHWGRDKMAAIFQTTFPNEFSWLKMYEYRVKFHWSLFLRVQLIISQHWFR